MEWKSAKLQTAKLHCNGKMIMSYSGKVEMSYIKLQYPDVIGGYCDGIGHDYFEQTRDKKTAHYPPSFG